MSHAKGPWIFNCRPVGEMGLFCSLVSLFHLLVCFIRYFVSTGKVQGAKLPLFSLVHLSISNFSLRRLSRGYK